MELGQNIYVWVWKSDFSSEKMRKYHVLVINFAVSLSFKKVSKMLLFCFHNILILPHSLGIEFGIRL